MEVVTAGPAGRQHGPRRHAGWRRYRAPALGRRADVGPGYPRRAPSLRRGGVRRRRAPGRPGPRHGADLGATRSGGGDHHPGRGHRRALPAHAAPGRACGHVRCSPPRRSFRGLTAAPAARPDAGQPRLRRRRADGGGARRRHGDSADGAPRAAPTSRERSPTRWRIRSPARLWPTLVAGAAGAGGAATGRRRIPRPHPADAQPDRPPAPVSLTWSSAGFPTPPSPCSAPRGPTVRPRRPRWRSSSAPTSSPATPSSITTLRATRTSRSGRSTGPPILLQRDYVEADVRIITGFVEPHFFAGFSGGPKAVCPGWPPPRRSSRRTTRGASPTPGHLRHPEGNPVHDFVRAAVALAPPHLSRRRGDQRGPPGHRRLRRPSRRGARRRLRVRRGRSQ